MQSRRRFVIPVTPLRLRPHQRERGSRRGCFRRRSASSPADRCPTPSPRPAACRIEGGRGNPRRPSAALPCRRPGARSSLPARPGRSARCSRGDLLPVDASSYTSAKNGSSLFSRASGMIDGRDVRDERRVDQRRLDQLLVHFDKLLGRRVPYQLQVLAGVGIAGATPICVGACSGSLSNFHPVRSSTRSAIRTRRHGRWRLIVFVTVPPRSCARSSARRRASPRCGRSSPRPGRPSSPTTRTPRTPRAS